jgi:hypothetical protein
MHARYRVLQLAATRGGSVARTAPILRLATLPILAKPAPASPSGLRWRNRAGPLGDEPVVLDAAVFGKVEAG